VATHALLSADVQLTGALAEQAIELAMAVRSGDKTSDEAAEELATAGDRGALQEARAALVGRIYKRSDDYEATGGLNVLNKAIALVGWHDPYSWKHRRKP
jgi:hypothetical protein